MALARRKRYCVGRWGPPRPRSWAPTASGNTPWPQTPRPRTHDNTFRDDCAHAMPQASAMLHCR
eukprot:2006397-Alexandrium_andersonii.AAC.1